MKSEFENWKRIVAGALVFLGCGLGHLHAQQGRGGGNNGGGGGGFGGFGGFGGNRTGGAASASTSAYNNNGTVGSAIISVDPQTHNIVVISDAETSLQISNVLRRLDVPKPQVLIKIVFVEVSKTDGSDIGVEGGWANNGANGFGSTAGNVMGLSGLNTVVTNFNALGQPISSSLVPGNNGGSGAFYQIVGSQYQATVKAIARGGKAQILSRPSILARDGQLAKIVVGQKVPLPSGVSYSQSGNTTIPIVNVTYTDVGIILNVTPFIGDNGLIQMIVQPQISSVSPTEKQSLSSDVSAPYLNVRSADTVVITPNSQTVVIGGLISDNKTSSETKVPFLGDIPLLGNLFKSKSKSAGKTELLIFLTPYIVEAPTQLAMLSSQETGGSQLITNSVSSEDLGRYLDTLPLKKEK
jgi:general secretion pathway protein D